jgi:RNA polymerase sigma factor (sigma-70 family)
VINSKISSVLWESFRSGDREAFACIYNMHVQALYKYGTKLCHNEELVKDAIQEVFLDLYLKRKKNTTSPENLSFYLILALKRNLIKKLQYNRKLTGEEACEMMFDPVYSIDKAIIEHEEEARLNHQISELLKNLPAKQKEALYLRFIESMEYSEIAQLLNITVESVRKQVYRAIIAIRKKFGGQGIVY